MNENVLFLFIFSTETPSSDFQDPELEFDEGGLELESKEGRY